MNEVDCPKHGRCYVVCISNRLAEYVCSMCWEEKVTQAEQENQPLPKIYD